ncbi:MAG: hypothetical protein KatS3mg015_0280 [Fimbriimonadales bacterium]|nr:MAG: hypothetical protein KatS3mg015_0280 [Fimbriimonadales bacterium]
MKISLFVVAALAVATAGQAAILWDNNIITNGFNGRAISPPAFPNIRVVDDIIAPVNWWVNRVRFNILEDTTFQHGGTIEVYWYNDVNGQPGGSQIALWTSTSYTRTPVGSYFGRPAFEYNVDFGQLLVIAGHYWIGPRHPNGSGSGTAYWMTSDGGPDGAGTSTGYFSLDAGTTWQPEGAGWHHAFVFEGDPVPEPATMLAIGAGLAALAARRRRK